MNLAFKDIRKNLGRFVMTTIGIGMLLMVVMGMAGIYRGLLEDATYLINKIGADLWIVQQDTRVDWYGWLIGRGGSPNRAQGDGQRVP